VGSIKAVLKMIEQENCGAAIFAAIHFLLAAKMAALQLKEWRASRQRR
jgi:hypothetical protein